MNAKKQIRDTFYKLCEHIEPQKISVNILIKKAGINRSTFYYYFENKQDLIEQLQTEILDTYFSILYFEGKYKEIVLEHYHSSPSPELYASCRYIQLNQHIFNIWFDDIHFINEYTTKLTIFLKGFSNNEAHCIFISYGAVGYFKKWLSTSCVMSSDDVAKEILLMSKQTFNH